MSETLHEVFISLRVRINLYRYWGWIHVRIGATCNSQFSRDTVSHVFRVLCVIFRIVTGCRINDRSLISGCWKRFLQNVETGSGAHPASYSYDAAAKDDKGWNWPLQFSAEVKNVWRTVIIIIIIILYELGLDKPISASNSSVWRLGIVLKKAKGPLWFVLTYVCGVWYRR